MTRLTRRQALAVIGTGTLGIGSAKAIDNAVLGYGIVGGTNLREQDLASLLAGSQSLRGEFTVAGRRYDVTDDAIRERRTDATEWQHHPLAEPAPDTPGAGELHRDVRAIDDGTAAYEPRSPTAFFDRLATGEARPYTTAALRGSVSERITPEIVREFAGADPVDPEGLVAGLKRGFREHAVYDMPRYVGGSIEDNVLRGAVDLRAPFEGPTDFETLLDRGRTGVFCYELTYRAIEAFHASPTTDQTPPVAGFWVRDRRHKHVYNGLASVIRDEGAIRVPITFIDYTHSTLYDDLRLRWLLGEGLAAYDRRHRADEIHWDV